MAKKFRCGLYARVSTDMQAAKGEGSLKSQEHMLKEYVGRRSTDKEEWVVVRTYVEKGKSGANTNRPEYRRMLQDLNAGLLDCILAKSISRLSRSLPDFYRLIEMLEENNCKLIILDQNFDTTSAQGRAMVKLSLVFAELERELTGERISSNFRARAERGLWNGNRLLGYDLDAERKGHLVVNEEEKVIVNLMFKKYLELGSFKKVAKWLNDNSYRTHPYVSRRGVEHKPREFAYSTVQHCLENHAYIGLKEINKINKGKKGQKEEEAYKTVKALWDPIVPEKIFWKVQNLIHTNSNSKGNRKKVPKHNFLFKGRAVCGNCSENGHKVNLTCTYGKNRHGKTYYYYVCQSCRKIKLGAGDFEKLITGRFRKLLEDEGLLDEMVKNANQRLAQSLPLIQEEKKALGQRLGRIKEEADNIITRFAGAQLTDVTFVEEKLRGLEAERKEIERSLEELELQIDEQEKAKVNAEFIRTNLKMYDRLHKELSPDQQVNLVRLLVESVTVHEDRIKIQFQACDPPFEFTKMGKKNGGFTAPEGGLSQRLSWWAIGDSNPKPAD